MNHEDPPLVGLRLLQLRKQRGMTLDAMASLSGVSRSMLSQIERSQANPTLATVWSLARALDIDLSELIGVTQREARARLELTQASFMPEIRTADGLCLLRILSPADRVGSFEWYELTIAPGGELRSEPHAKGSREHLTILSGELLVQLGEEQVSATVGATARYPADVAHAIINCSTEPATAILVVNS